MKYAAVIASLLAVPCLARTPDKVLVVINQGSEVSRQIGQYYVQKRAIPAANVCTIQTTTEELITRDIFNREVHKPIGDCLRSRGLIEKVLYIVTTLGVPLKIGGKLARDGDFASVDSELTMLYSNLKGQQHALTGFVPNPYFDKLDIPFTHPSYALYMVTRLAGYDFADVKAMIDKALVARNTGKFVIDLRSAKDEPGNNWLRSAALLLPKNRLVVDESEEVIKGERDVIGYASWGSNDKARKDRTLGFKWLPGAVMTEFVSTNARTFKRPPATWKITSFSADHKTWFAGSPQTMTADYVHEGVTGASGHVDEPYLHTTPRPDYLLPAYYSGRNLAESFWLSIPVLSWQNVVIGDPLCTIGKPPR